jgi:hypothetical protein
MTEIIEKNNIPSDYYEASLENGSLVMQPFCACGNDLNENYFCEKCSRKCQCRQVICQDEETLALVRRYIRKSSQFSGLKIKLAEKDSA